MKKTPKNRADRDKMLFFLARKRCRTCYERQAVEVFRGLPICRECLTEDKHIDCHHDMTSSAGAIEENGVFAPGDCQIIYEAVKKNGVPGTFHNLPQTRDDDEKKATRGREERDHS